MKMRLRFLAILSPLFLLAAPAWAVLSIGTTDTLPTGYLSGPSSAYTATFTCMGGTLPCTFAVTSGALPTSLTLSSAGVISGTPTVAGSYTFQVTATDATTATSASTFHILVFDQPLDVYGGLTNKPCTADAGHTGHFYTAKIGNRWYLCTPAGNAFWMSSVSAISSADTVADYQGVNSSALISSKYTTGLASYAPSNWALGVVRRLQSWGFTTTGTFSYTGVYPGFSTSWPAGDHTIPVKMPYVILATPSPKSLTNAYGWGTGYVKDLMLGISTSVYNGYRWKYVDIWDSNWANYVSGSLTKDTYGTTKAYTNSHNDYLIGFEVDNADDVGGFGSGVDFTRIDRTTGQSLGKGGQLNLGWVALVTAPTQSSGYGVTYTDTTVYTKKEFSTWLAARYSNYIAALNTAWGSHYTTFGSNGGFGVGTGLLDENGKCPAKTTACWVPTATDTLAGATTAMKADLNAFMLLHAQHYFSTIKSAVNAAAPGFLYLGDTSIGSWNSPPPAQILQAAGQYLDVVSLDTIPPDCASCTDSQARIDFVALNTGDKPWITFRLYPANADSYESPWAMSSDWFKTQAARGQYYQNQMMPQIFNACDTPTGTCHEVGLQWWAWVDSRPEHANWGLVTPRDDPYDGASTSITQTYDAWGYPTGCLPHAYVGSATSDCEMTAGQIAAITPKTGWTNQAPAGASYGNFLGPVTAGNLWAIDATAGVAGGGGGDPGFATIISPSPTTFSSQSVGAASSSQTVTLSNTGTRTLNIASIATNNAAFALSPAATCGSTLAAGASCFIYITLTPTVKGTATGTLTVTDDSGGVGGSTQTVTLTGTANAPYMSGGKSS